jgi:hypothetical protein
MPADPGDESAGKGDDGDQGSRSGDRPCRKTGRVAGRTIGSRPEFHFIADTGRMSDIAFAIALDQNQNPITILLEISIILPRDGASPEQSVLGLLALDNPSPQLVDTFLLAHQALGSGSAAVEHLENEAVRNILRIQ